jgi:hypothetical protein
VTINPNHPFIPQKFIEHVVTYSRLKSKEDGISYSKEDEAVAFEALQSN